MKRLLFVLLIVVYPAGSNLALSGNPKVPIVVSAVAPVFPAIAATAHMSDDVSVEVEVNSEGVVSTAHAINAHPILGKASENAALRWRFAPDRGGDKTPVVRLTFSYRTMPLKTPDEELASIFMPPYHVEVRRRGSEPIFQNGHEGRKTEVEWRK